MEKSGVPQVSVITFISVPSPRVQLPLVIEHRRCESPERRPHSASATSDLLQGARNVITDPSRRFLGQVGSYGLIEPAGGLPQVERCQKRNPHSSHMRWSLK